MEFKDYYQLLGLARNASADDIKKSYRKLARKYHPDVSKESDAEARFKEIREAYEVLKDAEKRAAYDRLGANWRAGQDFQAPPDWNAGFESPGRGSAGPGPGSDDYSDFFETLFRQGFAGAGSGRGDQGARGQFHAHGEDHHARIQIEVEDAYRGATRSLNLRLPQMDAEGRTTMRERTIEFTVPKGVRAGQHIRLAGQGGPAIGKGKAGDLYLEVEFRPHAHYRVEHRDVYLDLPVAPWEAALGATIEVPTPAGSVELTIPAGSNAGRKLRLRGRGIPGVTPGDFYFVLQIALPPAHSDAEQAVYTAMRAQFKDFKPRAKLEGSS
ncbi:MAG: DnaJ C-terminal domain-containing protein [Burkholderiaceae bacterium]